MWTDEDGRRWTPDHGYTISSPCEPEGSGELIMVKLARDKIMEHMEENNLFTKHQHGFRKGYSCVTQLIDVCDKWSEELDNKNCIDILYLDFQKAFDSVPHQRLLTKLKGYGFKRKLLTWVENFLKNRKHF